jgi:hypothetical protein
MSNKDRVLRLLDDIKASDDESSLGLILSYAMEIRRECADAAIKWQVKLCADDDWTCERCTECTLLREAIIGSVHG